MSKTPLEIAIGGFSQEDLDADTARRLATGKIPPCAAQFASPTEKTMFGIDSECEGKVEPHHLETGTPPFWACAHHWSILGPQWDEAAAMEAASKEEP